jgi:tetratricopeptide (TPR) repeat protein
VFIARGEVDELEEKPDQAISSYRQAIDMGSRDPYCVYQLLDLLTRAHRAEEADQLIRKMDQVGVGTAIGQLKVFKDVINGQDPKFVLEKSPSLFRADSKSYRDHLMRGQLLSTAGRVSADAEAALRRAVALGGKQPETWVALVRYLGSTGQYNQALEEIGKAGKQLDDRVKLPAQAACLEVLGALDPAERMYRKALAEQPKSAYRQRLLADFLLRFGKPHDAEPLYRAVLDAKAGAGEEDATAARRRLAQALARGGNPKHTAEALELVGLKLDAAGNVDAKSVAASTGTRLLQARVLAALGMHALRTQAIGLFEPLYQKQALAVEDQYQLALLLHLAGPDAAAWKKARDILTSITTQQPHDTRYLAAYANLLLAHKEVADAEPLIARLEQMEQDRKLAMGLLGSVELKARALEQRGKEQQAVALLQDYAQQQDALPARKLLLAALCGRLGNYEEAIDLCYEVKAKGLREESYAAAIGLMRASRPAAGDQAKLGRWQPQMARLEEGLHESIRLDEKNVILRLQLADLLDLAGRGDQSAKVWREVLTLDPDNLVARNNLAWMLAQQDGQGPQALALIQQAIAKHGARPELLDTRAVVYLATGDAPAAVRDLEQAIRAAPTPARYFHLTRAHDLAKNLVAARVALERADALGLDVQRLAPTDQRAYERLAPELRKQ